MLIFLISLSNNKKKCDIQEYFIFENNKFEVIQLFDKHVSKLPRYYNMIDAIPTSYLSSPNMN
jgi:hypothetical protein